MCGEVQLCLDQLVSCHVRLLAQLLVMGRAALTTGKDLGLQHTTPQLHPQAPCPTAPPPHCHLLCSQVKLNSEARNTCWVSFDGRHQQELLVGDRLVWQEPCVPLTLPLS
ncbi:NAD kinase [Portunus trituberculatus]|uniref:NAD kinase n=1 Tax=Portunus trituberculatus TaxID=210409 RepID=A0A5B7DFR8_PORTR|nr:NAD kinase [Portunus trituberculatus]